MFLCCEVPLAPLDLNNHDPISTMLFTTNETVLYFSFSPDVFSQVYHVYVYACGGYSSPTVCDASFHF